MGTAVSRVFGKARRVVLNCFKDIRDFSPGVRSMHESGTRRLAILFGLALYWPYFRRFEFEGLFGAYSEPSAMWMAYTLVTCLNVVLLLLGALSWRRVDGLCSRRSLGVIAGSLFSAGYLAVYILPILNPALEVFGLVAGSALLAVGFCGLTLAWMTWLVRGSQGAVLEDALVSFALCCVLSFSALFPSGVVLAFTFASPLASGFIWSLLNAPGERAPYRRAVSLGVEKPTMPSLAAMCLLLFIGRITAGLIHFDGGSVQLIERTTSVVVSCVILAAVYVAARRAGSLASMVRRAWIALVVVFLTGETAVVLFSGVVQEVGMAVFWACLACFEVLILSVVAMWCGSSDKSPVLVMGLATLLLRVLPSWVGKYGVPAGMCLLGVAPASTVVAFVLASSLVLMTATLLFLNEMVESYVPDVSSSADRRPDLAVPVRDRSVERLSEAYLLTQREADVLALLLQGLSYQAVANHLCVTLGTVQTHTKSLYRKMDVHSRDELIERARAEQ